MAKINTVEKQFDAMLHKSNKYKTIAARIPVDLHDKVVKLASKKSDDLGMCVKMSDIVRNALDLFFKSLV